jgi:hypothetical protein
MEAAGQIVPPPPPTSTQPPINEGGKSGQNPVMMRPRRLDTRRKSSIFSNLKTKISEMSARNPSESLSNTPTSGSIATADEMLSMFDASNYEDLNDFSDDEYDNETLQFGGGGGFADEDNRTMMSQCTSSNTDLKSTTSTMVNSTRHHRVGSAKSTTMGNDERHMLRHAYYNLMCSILDPNAQLTLPHQFQAKTFTKITTCDECRSVLWGIHKQGLQCTRCNMCLHEKCQELTQVGCVRARHQVFGRANSRGSLKLQHADTTATTASNVSSSSSNSGGNSVGSSAIITPSPQTMTPTAVVTSFAGGQTASPATSVTVASPGSAGSGTPMQASLDGRYADVVEASPRLFPTIEALFVDNGVTLTSSLEGDIRHIQQDFVSKSVKRIKTKLNIFVKVYAQF